MSSKMKGWLWGIVVAAILILPIVLSKKPEVGYKTVETYDAFMEVIKTDKVVMTVFGRNSCSWCEKFKPVYSKLASEHNLDIYYLDSDSFDSNEFGRILMESELIIPEDCRDVAKNPDGLLSGVFGTPLTLFVKNGEAIDCISGYLNEDNLLAKLKTVGMVK